MDRARAPICRYWRTCWKGIQRATDGSASKSSILDARLLTVHSAFHATAARMQESQSPPKARWTGRRNLFLVLAASGAAYGALAFAAEQRGDYEPGTGPPRPLPGPVWKLPPPSSDPTQPSKKRIVILGSGWAAVSLLKGVDTRQYDVILVSPRNYFLFTPLLPGVTSGSVEGRSISEPIRRIIWAKHKNATYCEAECMSIDPVAKVVKCRDTSKITSAIGSDFAVEYDFLVVAVGAQPNTFNTPGVTEYAHFLKEIQDADRIRESVVDLLETASLPNVTEEEKRRLLRFVVVGGGPTGVEFAAELHDMMLEDVSRLYPDLLSYVSITVIQSGDHILNTYDQRISSFAEKKFSRAGVKVKTGCRVLSVGSREIVVKDKWAAKTESVPYGLVLWSTGIGTRPVAANLMDKIGQKNRQTLATDEWLRVKNAPDVYAAGDCAGIEQRTMQEDIEYLFRMAAANENNNNNNNNNNSTSTSTNANNNNTNSSSSDSESLTYEQFEKVLECVRARYPQIDAYLTRKHVRGYLSDLEQEGKKKAADSSSPNTTHRIGIKEFKERLTQVDSQMKTLPATAQVAAQQGEYLAHCFNHMAQGDSAQPEGPIRVRGTGRHLCMPFRYKHFGQFAPLGGGEAGFELPGDWVSLGRSTQWLWYSVYASKQVSWRTRCLVVFDWTKRAIFGRDSSRM